MRPVPLQEGSLFLPHSLPCEDSARGQPSTSQAEALTGHRSCLALFSDQCLAPIGLDLAQLLLYIYCLSLLGLP